MEIGMENLDISEEMESVKDEDISEGKYTDVNAYMLPETRYDVPDVEVAIVSGDPEGAAQIVDFVQGDEVEGAEGTCGLTSIANICRLSGMEVTEGEVVTYALENGLCGYNPWEPGETGGVNDEQMVEILRDYGIEADAYDADQYDLEFVAQAIESGRGVIAGVDAGTLWNDPAYTDTICGHRAANHAITLTGVARDAETGNVAGFYICDSGAGDACRYISAEEFHEMCGAGDIEFDSFIITDDNIRRA